MENSTKTEKRLIFGQFNDSYPPIIDGVAQVVKNYAYWLNEKYGESKIICVNAPGAEEDDPFEVLRFRSYALPFMKPYRVGAPILDPVFLKRFVQIPFDIIHSHCPFISGYLALRIARAREVPIISTLHSKYRDDFRKILNNDILVDKAVDALIAYYNAVDYVWVLNNETKNLIRDYGYTGDVDIVPNGTDISIPSNEELLEYRQRGYEYTGISPDETVLLYVGQQRWEKNLRLIIESLAELKKRGRKVTVLSVGTGSDIGEMERMIDSLDLGSSFRFLGLIRDREVLKSLYASSYLFLFPSLYDLDGLVKREAAAFSVPTVFIKGSVTASGITHGVNGILTSNNPGDFAGTIECCIDHPDLVAETGSGARKSLYISWEDVVSDVYDRYMDILRDYTHKPFFHMVHQILFNNQPGIVVDRDVSPDDSTSANLTEFELMPVPVSMK